MAQCDLNKDYPIFTSTFFGSAREWIRDFTPEWDAFFTFYRGVTKNANGPFKGIKQFLVNSVNKEGELVQLKDLALKAFGSHRPENSFSYSGGLDQGLARVFYDTISNASHITGLSEEAAFSVKIGKGISNISSLNMWKRSIRNGIEKINNADDMYKFLELMGSGEVLVNPFNLIYNFAPDAIKNALKNGVYIDSEGIKRDVDYGKLLGMKKGTTDARTVKYLFDRLTDQNMKSYPPIVMQIKELSFNSFKPLRLLNAFAASKFNATVNRIAKILPQFTGLLAPFGIKRASTAALQSLVYSGFMGSLTRNLAAKSLSGFEHSDLKNLTIKEVMEFTKDTFIESPWFKKLENLLVDGATLADGAKFDTAMLFGRREDLVATVYSGPQNIAVDSWHGPSYLRYAIVSAASQLGITTADEFRNFMKDPILKAKMLGIMEETMDIYLAANKEASITKAQMPFLYHTMFFFGNRGWNMAKQIVSAPLGFLRRTILGVNKGDIGTDFKETLLNNTEFRLFTTTIVTSLLMASKMERLFGQNDDDEDKPYYRQQIEFYKDFFSNFIPYFQAFVTNGMLRLVTLPTEYNIEVSNLKDVDGNDIPLTTVEAIESYVLQALNEMKSSFKFFDLISKIVRGLNDGSYTAEGAEGALAGVIEQFAEGYANAVAGDMNKGLNVGGYIPQDLKTNSDIRFMFGLSSSDSSDLNFKLSQHGAFARLLNNIVGKVDEDGGTESFLEDLGKLFDKTGFGFVRDAGKAVMKGLLDQNVIDQETFSRFEIKESIDELRRKQAPWTNAQVDFSQVNPEAIDYLFLNTMKAVYNVDKDGNYDNFYSPKLRQDENGIWSLDDTLKSTKVATGKKDKFGNPEYKSVMDRDLYLQVFDNQLATKYPTEYEGIKESIKNAMKIEGGYNARNEAMHSYMELYQNVAPKVKLALAMKAYTDLLITQGGGSLKLHFNDAKANDYKGTIEYNPLSPEYRNAIKAEVLNTFQRSLRDVDADLRRKTFLLSNKGDPVAGRLLDANGTSFDYNKLGKDLLPASQLAGVQFTIGLGNAKGLDTSKYNNTISSFIYNYQNHLERNGLDKDLAKASALNKFFEVLPSTHYSEQNKLELVASHFTTDTKSLTSLWTNPKVKEFLGEGKTNYLKELVFGNYQSLNKMEDERNWLETDVKNLRDASGKLFGFDNINGYKGSGFGSSGYYSSNYSKKTYPNITSYQTAIKNILPFYAKESRVNFTPYKSSSYNKQDYNLFKAQNNYVKQTYTVSPRLNKQGGNTVSGNVGRGKGFGVKVERRKSSFAVKATSGNKRSRKKA